MPVPIALLLAAAMPDQPRCRAGAAQAGVQLRRSDAAAARHDDRTAAVALDAALQALGDRYAPPGAIDDTDTHLVVADLQASKGHRRLALTLKRRVLVERLQLCRQPARSPGR